MKGFWGLSHLREGCNDDYISIADLRHHAQDGQAKFTLEINSYLWLRNEKRSSTLLEHFLCFVALPATTTAVVRPVDYEFIGFAEDDNSYGRFNVTFDVSDIIALEPRNISEQDFVFQSVGIQTARAFFHLRTQFENKEQKKGRCCYHGMGTTAEEAIQDVALRVWEQGFNGDVFIKKALASLTKDELQQQSPKNNENDDNFLNDQDFYVFLALNGTPLQQNFMDKEY